ncbi:hypothetical protein KFE96_03520 [Kordiimonas sp. SCSIO 12603]|uniref:hypothetical protein n=1 Tax=Kordiimonas sp. SCSIO 12603 TaxID=2829596 RepID=UPI00210456E2|nr:hypothetical protein [Kordiimonas sp. SCSIO 12603]UTW59391.1 hypothetical protein KFE96_03520 [Kordiimonas sp. SCSIO 12603]
MKLKNIKSFSHNFTHSFVSYNNYIDDGFVMRDLAKLARANQGEAICIDWLSEEPPFCGRIAKSIKLWKKRMPELLKSHNITLDCIFALRTEVRVMPNYEVSVLAFAKDINGKEYQSLISEFVDCPSTVFVHFTV